ncbi:MAG: hypothetical protein NTW21_01450 [Verrucomicrobia bacterium]|nr:hypothetical protein [Verrucomicrobiota bacterium]
MKPITQGVVRTETAPPSEPQSSTWFRKTVTGSSRIIITTVVVGLMALRPAAEAQREDNSAAAATPPGGFQLGTRRNDETGKASFLLNGQPFYPFVYYENYRAVTPKLLAHLRSEGFNSIQL